MQFRIPGYNHDANSVSTGFQISRSLNQQGFPDVETRRLTIRGNVTGTSQATLNDEIRSLERSYRSLVVQIGTSGLYDDNGNLTEHKLVANHSIGGINLDSLEWDTPPPEDGSQFATRRSFNIVLSARYRLAPKQGQNTTGFRENVVVTGGQPQVAVVELLNGPPQIQVVKQQTAVRVIQSGTATGRFNYPRPASPFQLVQETAPEIRRTSPEGSEGGAPNNYGISWTYRYVSTGGVHVLPHLGV
jgi:hypothetical protein